MPLPAAGRWLVRVAADRKRQAALLPDPGGRLAAVEELNTNLKGKLARLVQRIGDVGEVDLREDLFRRVQIHRNNADYGFLLDLCRIIARHLFPEAQAGPVRFRDFTTDEREMGRLFEGFVRGFLRTEHPRLGVRGHKSIKWDAALEGDAVLRLPRMETDIYVPGAAAGRSVIVETKCVSEPFVRAGEASTLSLRSDHLYQLFAYLASHARSYARAWIVSLRPFRGRRGRTRGL